jgi:uncharacterized protein (DUF1330 family)
LSDPTYLIVRTAAPASRFERFCARNGRRGGRVTAAQRIDNVTALEPGSAPMHVWIARFPTMTAAKAAWADVLDTSDLKESGPPLVVAARAVPDEGFPPEMSFVPTRANVDPGSGGPPTLMLIEGSASDQARMDRYRDIILPMMRDLKSYYTVFELGGAVEVLSGEWSEAIFAISRWPSRAAALKFWNAPKYQETAIPLRLDIGRFSVLILEGEADHG